MGIQSDIEKLRQTMDGVSVSDFTDAVNTIANSKRIYILGARTCFSIANFLGFYLGLLSYDAKLITTNSASETFEQIFDIFAVRIIIKNSKPSEKLNLLKFFRAATDFSKLYNLQIY